MKKLLAITLVLGAVAAATALIMRKQFNTERKKDELDPAEKAVQVDPNIEATDVPEDIEEYEKTIFEMDDCS